MPETPGSPRDEKLPQPSRDEIEQWKLQNGYFQVMVLHKENLKFGVPSACVACAAPLELAGKGKKDGFLLTYKCEVLGQGYKFSHVLVQYLCMRCSSFGYKMGDFVHIDLCGDGDEFPKLRVQVGNESLADAWCASLTDYWRRQRSLMPGELPRILGDRGKPVVERFRPDQEGWVPPLGGGGGCAIALAVLGALSATSVSALLFLFC